MSLGPLGQTIASLQSFYASMPAAPTTDQLRARAQSLPDPELAVRVHRFLPRRKAGTADPYSEAFSIDDVTEAFLLMVLNEDTGVTPKGIIPLRALLRAASRNMGIAFAELYETVVATGFGVVPTLTELAETLRRLLALSEMLVAADKVRDARRKQLKKHNSDGELEPWVVALAEEWLGRFGLNEPSAEEIQQLLLDDAVLARLSKVEGMSWDVLATQARSLLSHSDVGNALGALASLGQEPRK